MKATKKQQYEHQLAKYKKALGLANQNITLLQSLLCEATSIYGPFSFTESDIGVLSEEFMDDVMHNRPPALQTRLVDKVFHVSVKNQTDADTLQERLKHPLEVYGSVYGTDKAPLALQVIFDILGGKK